MSKVEIEIESGEEEAPKEPSAAEKAKLLDELKALLLPNGPYGSMSVEARNAAVDAVMAKLKGEKED